MILAIHIPAAILSLIFAGFLYFYPSKLKLQATYATTAVMLVTGFFLILSKPAHMTQTCIEGLSFLAIISYAIVSARRRLVA